VYTGRGNAIHVHLCITVAVCTHILLLYYSYMLNLVCSRLYTEPATEPEATALAIVGDGVKCKVCATPIADGEYVQLRCGGWPKMLWICGGCTAVANAKTEAVLDGWLCGSCGVPQTWMSPLEDQMRSAFLDENGRPHNRSPTQLT
jgi:hypothetical protein